MPDSVVLLVGTHCDQCRDQEEVMEKKNNIDEKVKAMLANRRMVLQHQKKNLEENKDVFMFVDQLDELDCLLEYNLKVLIVCSVLFWRDFLKTYIFQPCQVPPDDCNEMIWIFGAKHVCYCSTTFLTCTLSWSKHMLLHLN